MLGGTLGLSYTLSPRLTLDAAYGIEAAGQRTARVAVANERVANIAGAYSTLVHRAAIGVSFQLF